MTDQPQQPAPQEIAASLENNLQNLQKIARDGLTPQTIASLLPPDIMQIASSFMGDEFIGEQLEANFPAIKEAIITRITDPDIPASENMLILALNDMTGEEIKGILQSSPELQTLIADTLVTTSNSGSLLQGLGISTEGIPAGILNKPVTEITTEDLSAVDNATLRNLVTQLPVSAEESQGFNAVLIAFNEKLDEDRPLLGEGATLEERQQAFDGAMAAIVEQHNTTGNSLLSGIRNFFNSAADDVSLEETITNEAYNAIRAAIPGNLKTMSAGASASINLDEMDPDELKALVTSNSTVIHAMITNPENRDAINDIITLDLIRNNMDNPAFSGMAMEMAAGQDNGMIAGLIGNIMQNFPGLQEMFDMFNGLLSSFIGPIFENMGFGNEEPQVATAPSVANQAPPAAEQEQEIAAAALPAGPA